MFIVLAFIIQYTFYDQGPPRLLYNFPTHVEFPVLVKSWANVDTDNADNRRK